MNHSLCVVFLRDLTSSSFQFPEDFSEHFKTICDSLDEVKTQGSLLDTQIYNASFKTELPKRSVYASFDANDTTNLQTFCSKILRKGTIETICVNSIHLKYSTISINDKQYNSSDKSSSDFVALAKFDTSLYGSSSSICTLVERPVKIHYYAKVSFTTNLELQVQKLLCHGSLSILITQLLASPLKYGVTACMKAQVF